MGVLLPWGAADGEEDNAGEAVHSVREVYEAPAERTIGPCLEAGVVAS
jgi:hypothetical protein